MEAAVRPLKFMLTKCKTQVFIGRYPQITKYNKSTFVCSGWKNSDALMELPYVKRSGHFHRHQFSNIWD